MHRLTRYLVLHRDPALADYGSGKVSTLDLKENYPKLREESTGYVDRVILVGLDVEPQMFKVLNVHTGILPYPEVYIMFKDSHASPTYWQVKERMYGISPVGYNSFDLEEVPTEPILPALPRTSRAGIRTFTDVRGESVGDLFPYFDQSTATLENSVPSSPRVRTHKQLEEEVTYYQCNFCHKDFPSTSAGEGVGGKYCDVCHNKIRAFKKKVVPETSTTAVQMALRGNSELV